MRKINAVLFTILALIFLFPVAATVVMSFSSEGAPSLQGCADLLFDFFQRQKSATAFRKSDRGEAFRKVGKNRDFSPKKGEIAVLLFVLRRLLAAYI